jgi:hypothetical protein
MAQMIGHVMVGYLAIMIAVVSIYRAPRSQTIMAFRLED